MKLRYYQETINRKIYEFMRGPDQRAQIYSPTGSGKTVSFIHALQTEISETERPLKVAILAPRIALIQDQLSRYHQVFDQNVIFTSFHSREHVVRSDVLEYSTLEAEQLLNTQSNCIANGQTHVTCSTYHSFWKLIDQHFDIIICDEAHNLTTDRFMDSLQQVQADKILFFTATPINNELEDELGMNNVELFGPIICEVLPRELIQKGYIVAPLIHRLEVTYSEVLEDVDPVEVAARSFLFQKEEMDSTGMPYTKMLVSCKGLGQIEYVNNHLADLWRHLGKRVNVYSSSADMAKKNNIVWQSRKAMLDDFNAHEGDAIIMHYDTLSEGIDISGITGVLLMRDMQKSKMLQTIGRAARPFTQDLDENYEPVEFSLRRKQRCVVSVMEYNGVPVLGNAMKFARAFIEGGYDDLSSYLSGVNTPLGTVKNQLELPGDADQSFWAAVQDIKRHRELTNITHVLFQGL